MKDATRSFLLLIGLIFLGGVLYANALDNSFHYDDEGMILSNEKIHHLSGLSELWTSALYADIEPEGRGHYRPLVLTSYLFNYALGGEDPAGYHLVNLFLHILTAFLAALIVGSILDRRLTGILAGLLFLVHPFHSEAVNYITARSSQLYAVFYLLSFYAYICCRPPVTSLEMGIAGKALPLSGSDGRRSLWLVLSFLFFAASLLSKEMAVTLPLTLFLYEFLLRRSPGEKLDLRYLWFPVLLILTGIVPYLAIRKNLVGAALMPDSGRDLVSQLATETVVLVRTFGLISYPSGLTINHRVEIYPSFALWPVVGSLILLIGLFGLFSRWGVSRGPMRRRLAFMGIWFFVSLSPLAVIPLHSMFQENRAYLAGIGVIGLWAAALVWMLDRVRKNPMVYRSIWGGIGVLMLVLGYLTFQRNEVWQDNITLWTDAVRKEPYSGAAHESLGLAYLRSGRLPEASDQYVTFWKLEPTNPNAVYGMGIIREKEGRLKEAQAWYQGAFRLNPGFYKVLLERGAEDLEEGKVEEAVIAYRRAVWLWPEGAEGHRGLAEALVRVGRREEAVSEYGTLLQLEKDPVLRSEVLRNLRRLRGHQK